MPTLPVHCCCDPSKRLGWLTFEGEAGVGMEVRFCMGGSDIPVVRLPIEWLRSLRPPAIDLFVSVDVGALLPDARHRQLAVKNNGFDLLVLRLLPGFSETEPASTAGSVPGFG